MNSVNFIELSEDGLLSVDGGNWFGNIMILTGSLVLLGAATGPVGLGVGVFCAVMSYSSSQAY